MTVRPTSTGQTPRPRIDRSEKAPAPGTPARAGAAPAASTPAARGDDVQISSQARELQRLDAAGQGPAGELAADRLKDVLSRMSDGFYDQPQVRDTVLSRLSKDL